MRITPLPDVPPLNDADAAGSKHATNTDNKSSDAQTVHNLPQPQSPRATHTPRHAQIRQALAYIADHVISGLIIGPLMVMCWRGGWNFLDNHLLPTDTTASGYCCAGISNVGLFVLVLLHPFLKARLQGPGCTGWRWWVGYHAYTLVCFWLNLCHWRGVWTLLAVYTGTGEATAWGNYAVAQGVLWLLRCSKSAAAAPMVVAVDVDPDFISFSTRFRTQPGWSEAHLLDVALTVFVVHQTAFMYWRGVWMLMDVYLVPDNAAVSYASSLGIAYTLMAVVCVAQPPFNTVYRRCQSPYGRWLLEVSLHFVSNLVCVACWRGVWGLCDTFILPDRPDVSAGLTLALGQGVLWLMLAGNTVTVRGCEMDGDAAPPDGCYCPNRYVRFFIELRRDGRGDVGHEGGNFVMANGGEVEKDCKAMNGLGAEEGEVEDRTVLGENVRSEANEGAEMMIQQNVKENVVWKALTTPVESVV